jgi:hypothetical protein
MALPQVRFFMSYAEYNEGKNSLVLDKEDPRSTPLRGTIEVQTAYLRLRKQEVVEGVSHPVGMVPMLLSRHRVEGDRLLLCRSFRCKGKKFPSLNEGS